MDGERISVVIPVYKAEPYIRQCLDTVLNQTHQNLEVILVDDGSPDGCPEICDACAAADPRVRVIHKDNGGVSSARNAGLGAATGRYVGFVDSDDWVDYDFFERLHRAAKESGADIAACGIIKVYERHHKRRAFYESDRTFSGEAAQREVLKNDQMSCHTWNKLFDRRLFDGILFPPGKCYEDIHVMHRVFERAAKVAVIADWKYYYRQRPDSITYTPSAGNLADYFDAHYTIYREKAQDAELRPYLVKLAAATALSLVKSGAPEGKYAPEFERARGFLREIRRDGALLRLLGPNARLEIRYPRCHRPVKRAVKLYHQLFPPRETDREPDWRALRAKGANILLGPSESENLGDSAIGYAEKAFFEREGMALVEITQAQFRTFKRRIRRAIGPGALIAIQGGGAMGSQYRDQEEIRSWAIRSFPKNAIVQFPQTVYFADTPAAEKLKRQAVQLYGTHKGLTLFAREAFSYEIMRNLYHNRVEIAPDIVMSLPPYESGGEREGALMILRCDVEANLNIQDYFDIKNRLARGGLSVEVSDTRLARRIPLERRDEELRAFLQKMASKKIVVTDRLHAMIFAAITGTPCIAFGNYNHKVLGGYQWLKDLGFVRFCSSADEFGQALGSLDLDKRYSYRDNGLEGAFESLRQAIHRQPAHP